MTKKFQPQKTFQAFERYTREFDFDTSDMVDTTTLLVEPEPPVVYYTPEVKETIDYLVETCTQEVGWLGLVTKSTDGDYTVTEIFIPEQTVHGAETLITKEAMEKLALELLDAGKDPSQLRYWGHSHVNMGVSPSAQDEDQVDKYLKNCDYFIRGIYNKRGDSKVDVYDKTQNLAFQCVEEHLTEKVNNPLHQQLNKIIKTNVKQRTFARTAPQKGLGQPAKIPTYYRNYPQTIPPGTRLDDPVEWAVPGLERIVKKHELSATYTLADAEQEILETAEAYGLVGEDLTFENAQYLWDVIQDYTKY